MRRTRGFTLTELMVVVLLFAVFASLATISISKDRDRGDLDAFARAVANTVNVARRRAVETGTAYLVDVRATSVAYCQINAAAPLLTCPNLATLESPAPYQAGPSVTVAFYAKAADTGQSPAKIAIGAGTSLQFNANGSCDSDTTTSVPDGFTLYLQGIANPDQKRTIAVIPFAARPRVTDNW